METERYVIVSAGHRRYKVPLEVYNEIHGLILEVIHALVPGCRYTAKMLVGPAWESLDSQSISGLCVVDMVENRRLPLIRIGCRHQSPVRYELAE